jgi:hypothetical protein
MKRRGREKCEKGRRREYKKTNIKGEEVMKQETGEGV